MAKSKDSEAKRETAAEKKAYGKGYQAFEKKEDAKGKKH